MQEQLVLLANERRHAAFTSSANANAARKRARINANSRAAARYDSTPSAMSAAAYQRQHPYVLQHQRPPPSAPTTPAVGQQPRVPPVQQPYVTMTNGSFGGNRGDAVPSPLQRGLVALRLSSIHSRF